MTSREPFDEWHLAIPPLGVALRSDLRVVTVWSFGIWAETTNEAIADAASAAAASRQPFAATLRGPSGVSHSLELVLVDLGYTSSRARLFELAPLEKDKPAFRTLFRDEVLPVVLIRRDTTHAATETMPFRWCFAGHAGPISTFERESGSFVALDPTGAMGRFADAYGRVGAVDVLLGAEHLTSVASLLFPGAGFVRVSARTFEVGRPIRFDALTSLIASCEELGSDLTGWRREIERAFPRAL